MSYKILMSKKCYDDAEIYKQLVVECKVEVGVYLAKVLRDKSVWDMSVDEFIECIMNTRIPTIFAESDVWGDGSDWNKFELSILGDISMAVPVTVYDNGLHRLPIVHNSPFEATLLYVAGALLRNEKLNTAADYDAVTINGDLDLDKYFKLYEDRLLPAINYANDTSDNAFVTITGLGCGQFAGPFRGTLESAFEKVLIRLLNKYSHRLPNIKAVYYDPYVEGHNTRIEIDHISLFVRPLLSGNKDKPQLCTPLTYGEEFVDCKLYSVVAWDHVSWAGNDYYNNYRMTDDGVKSAATSSMYSITGFEGKYNPTTFRYEPPCDYNDWGELVKDNKLDLEVVDNLVVYTTDYNL